MNHVCCHQRERLMWLPAVKPLGVIEEVRADLYAHK